MTCHRYVARGDDRPHHLTNMRPEDGICHACGLQHGTKVPTGPLVARWDGTCKWCHRYMTIRSGGVARPAAYGIEA